MKVLFISLILTLVIGPVYDYSKLETLHPLESKSDHKLKVGVIGLVHTHVHWILGREKLGDIEIVAIVEPNTELAQRYAEQHGYSMDIVFNTMEEMSEHVDVDAVTVFNTIYDHLNVVEFFAPKGIHIMVEKPLAVSIDHANRMVDIARKYNVHLLTNYETTWYPSTHRTYELINNDSRIGSIRKMKFYTGHPGPIEIGCNEEFLEWLTDPVLNGGGALTDFGCYGANISTWMMMGEQPLSVTAITKQLKPHLYPDVEDEALIIIDYKNAQSIIEASWNWSHNRKDMEVFGTKGYIQSTGGNQMVIMEDENAGFYKGDPPPLKQGCHDPFALLHKVVKEGHELSAYDLNSLENNLMVMQILELAKTSAKENRTVYWEEFFK
ncbi:MAG: Gfo/Idh/MocA family oxidoreductase [Saprospiraceae bacterium]|nr:Gfo/Idh/MocA family oxidoreductase [Saprospiraceae bacterium]